MERRQFLHTLSGGMVGALAIEGGLAFHDPPQNQVTQTGESTCENVVYTSEFPEVDWNTKHIPDYGIAINWYDGYEQDAQWVETLIPHFMPKANETFPYGQTKELIINLYPSQYYPRSGAISGYDRNMGRFLVMTPTDHWERDFVGDGYDSPAAIWYRHAILDGLFSKRIFERQEKDIIIPDWFKSGFVEEITVNHTYQDIEQEYTTNKRMQGARDLVNNGLGSVMSMSTRYWSGSQLFAASLIDEIGIKPIVDAMIDGPNRTFVANLEASEGVSELDMMATWYTWLDENTDADYSDEISKLSETPPEPTEQNAKIDELGAAGVVGGFGGTLAGFALGNGSEDGSDE